MTYQCVRQQLRVKFESVAAQAFDTEPRLVNPDEPAPVALGELGVVS